jgi:hypothetical protein
MFPEVIYCPLICIWGLDELPTIILELAVAEGGPLDIFDEVL